MGDASVMPQKPASSSRVFFVIRRKNTSLFVEASRDDTLFDLKKKVAPILEVGCERLRLHWTKQIVQLNSDLERVKLEQQKLDHELDFVHSQQRELADLLTPLEAALEAMPAISYQQHADLEREHTYQLAENLDAQLKRMGQDLKEIIDRLNSSNTKPDPDDPVQQITKILNAHMDSLLWVDRQTGTLNRRVEEMGKLMENERKEQERNFRLAYS